MRRRTALAALGSGLALLAGCSSGDGSDPTDNSTDDPTTTPASSSPSTALRNPSFESNLDGWTVGSDVPDDPSGDGPVDTEEMFLALQEEGER